MLHIKSNSPNYNSEVLFTSILPRYVVVGLVNSVSFTGKYSSLPFIFENFGLTNISLVADNQVMPQLTYTINKEKGICAQAYSSLSQVCNSRSGNGISKEMFLSNTHLLIFELERTGFGNTFPKQKYGSLQISMEFATPTVKDITAIVVGFFPSIVQVKADNTVKVI